MALLKLHLKASGILELVVAMVIISLVTSISLLIYVNTITSLKTNFKQQLEVKAQYYLDTYEQLEEENKTGFIDELNNEISITKVDTELESLYELTITVTDSLYVNSISKRRLLYEYEE